MLKLKKSLTAKEHGRADAVHASVYRQVRRRTILLIPHARSPGNFQLGFSLQKRDGAYFTTEALLLTYPPDICAMRQRYLSTAPQIQLTSIKFEIAGMASYSSKHVPRHLPRFRIFSEHELLIVGMSV